MTKNPYETPDAAGGEDERDDAGPQKIILTREGRLNLGFAATLCRGLAVFCGFGALFLTYRLYANLGWLTMYYGHWGPMHYLEIARGLYIPALAVTAWLFWQFYRSLKLAAMLKFMPGKQQMEVHIQRLTWVLIGLSLFALISVIETVFKASLMYFQLGAV